MKPSAPAPADARVTTHGRRRAALVTGALLAVAACRTGEGPAIEDRAAPLLSEGWSGSVVRTIGGRCSLTTAAFCRADADCPAGETCADHGQRLRATALPAPARCDHTPAANGPCCLLVAGYYERGDGGGGLFCYDSTSSANEDLGLVVKPSSNPSTGRWLRQADTNTHVEWFGARCDGSATNKTVDTAAFTQAIKAVHATGGTILLPAGRSCVVRQLDLGQADPSPPAPFLSQAIGLTFRGAGAYTPAAVAATTPGASTFPASTIVLDPDSPTSSTSNPICDWQTTAPASPTGGGGIAIGPNVNHVTFEDLELRAGGNLGSCIVNISTTAAFGDPYRISFRRVQFTGNGVTKASVFLRRSSWLTFDQCRFSGSQYAIKEDFSPEAGGASSYSTSPEITNNLFYRASRGSLNTVPLIELWDVSGGRIAGNKLEYGPNGIYIGQLTGGSIEGNWANGEGEIIAAPATATWFDIGCNGCSIDGNHFEWGWNGVRVRGSGGRVSANYFIAQQGTPVSVEGNAIRVEGNHFFGGTSVTDTQTDILVASGVGHQIGTNYFRASAGQRSGQSILLAAGTRGTLVHDTTLDLTTNRIVDQSGLWQKLIDASFVQLALADATLSSPVLTSNAANEARLSIKRGEPTIGGATLNLENDGGRNNTLVLNDTVAGGAYGGIQIRKVGATTVNIAGAGLAGPTYFNAGDNVGIGTSAPVDKLQVSGGNVYLSSPAAGVILRSPDGSVCRKLAIANDGGLSTSPVSCP
jgi:hypothetical protein